MNFTLNTQVRYKLGLYFIKIVEGKVFGGFRRRSKNTLRSTIVKTIQACIVYCAAYCLAGGATKLTFTSFYYLLEFHILW